MAECREEDKQMLYEAKASADSAHLRLNDHRERINDSDDGINEIKLILRELQIGQQNILDRNANADKITQQLDLANTRHRNELTEALRALTLSNNGQEVAIALERGKREARERIINTWGIPIIGILISIIAWLTIEVIELRENDAKDHKHKVVGITKEVKVKARKEERKEK